MGEDLEYIQKHHCRISAVGSLRNGKHPTYHPVLPQEPSTEHFWTPVLHDSALETYLFYSNAGGGFLHLNTADSTLTLSSSSGIDEHAWVVVEEVSLDVGNFTFVNLFSNAHLAVGQNEEQTVPVRLTGAPESYNATWIPVRLEDGYYRFQTQIDSGKLLKADGTALTVGTATDDSTKWTVKMDEQSGGYYLKNNSTGTVLADRNGALCLVTEPELANGTYLWKTEDFFALRAEPDDKVEFALHHLQSGKYPEYESVFGSGSSGALTVEEFNAVVDETVADSSQSYGYTAQTRSVCQRFTFEKKDVEGDVYYHILPLLRVDEEVKCVYRSEYRLVAENGTVKVKEMTVSGVAVEDPTSGRWRLQQTAGGKYLIKNVSTGTYLNMENNAVCLTQQQPRSTLWTLKAICLNAEKDYQRTSYTCGAASATMIMNYLMPDSSITEEQYVEGCNQFGRNYQNLPNSTQKYYQSIGYNKLYMNALLKERINQEPYSVIWNIPDISKLELLYYCSKSINNKYPVLYHMKTKGRLEIISVWGYNSGGHYVVSKGVYYNNTSGNYELVVNDPHYKFAGGREINVSLQDLFDANKEELLYGM